MVEVSGVPRAGTWGGNLGMRSVTISPVWWLFCDTDARPGKDGPVSSGMASQPDTAMTANGPSHDDAVASVQALQILLVEDDEHDTRLISQLVRRSIADGRTIELTQAGTLAEAIQNAPTEVSVILSDLNLPDSEGANTIASLAGAFAGIPIIALTIDDERGVECIRAGAQDFVPKLELNGRTLRRAIEFAVQRSAKTSEIEYLSRHDPLTGLLNRWAFEEAVSRFPSKVDGVPSGVVALVIDVDEFKTINDNYGHAFGDKVLKMIARRMSSSTRADDVACRLGGDEFALIAHVADKDASIEVAVRVDEAVHFETESVRPSDGGIAMVEVSASVGSVYVPYGTEFRLDDLLSDADTSMYQRKNLRVPRAREGS